VDGAISLPSLSHYSYRIKGCLRVDGDTVKLGIESPREVGATSFPGLDWLHRVIRDESIDVPTSTLPHGFSTRFLNHNCPTKWPDSRPGEFGLSGRWIL
jgi:hypothetical protein